MNILLTGATGMIGSALLPLLQQHRVWCLVRRPVAPGQLAHGAPVRAVAEIDTPLDAVINLAGENIGAKRWTRRRKADLRNSRIGFTEQLIQSLAAANQSPPLWINASAVGYYGDRPGEPLTEASTAGEDFAAKLCDDWEIVAASYPHAKQRVILRLGVVIGDGGVVDKLALPFRLGLGATMGPGDQHMPWVALDDVCQVIRDALDNTHYDGIYNLVAPQRLTQQQFSAALAAHYRQRLLFRIPGAALKIMMGEMSLLLLADQDVRPEALSGIGYAFKHPDITSALDAI